MSRWLGAWGAALLGISLTAPAPAQTSPTGVARQKMDVSKYGPQVGEKVPDFNLQDQFGKTRNLSSIMGPKGAMLVFIRSADW